MAIVPSLADNFRRIASQIESALKARNRPSGAARLLAVGKDQPAASLRELMGLGQREFGENYVQEWKEKRAALNEEPVPPRWHFIGHLQSNKVKDLVGEIALFHSIDRFSLAQKIDGEARKKGIVLPGLVELNLGDEASKSGVSEKEVDALFQELNSLPNLSIQGLMVLPPISEDPEATRPYFRRLREILFDLNRKSVYRSPLSELSMGMSNDYLAAVEEGATWVRIGRALFGERRSR